MYWSKFERTVCFLTLFLILGGIDTGNHFYLLSERNILFIQIKNYILFKQDYIPCSTNRCVKQWLQNDDIKLLESLPNSPDLSPIENLYNVMEIKVASNKTYSTDCLKEAMMSIWMQDVNEDQDKSLGASTSSTVNIYFPCKY